MDYMKEFIELTEEQAEVFILDSVNWGLRNVCRNLVVKDNLESTVLDVGCGNGNDSGRYSCDNYVGVDISDVLLRAARKRHPNHKFLQCDASKMPFRDGEFEFVFCVSLMEHLHSLQDTRSVLKEMIRVASSRIVISWHKIPSETRKTEIRTVVPPVNRHFGHTAWSNTFNTMDLISGIIDKDKITITPYGKTCCLWEISK